MISPIIVTIRTTKPIITIKEIGDPAFIEKFPGKSL